MLLPYKERAIIQSPVTYLLPLPLPIGAFINKVLHIFRNHLLRSPWALKGGSWLLSCFQMLEWQLNLVRHSKSGDSMWPIPTFFSRKVGQPLSLDYNSLSWCPCLYSVWLHFTMNFLHLCFKKEEGGKKCRVKPPGQGHSQHKMASRWKAEGWLFWKCPCPRALCVG